jgi:hypothetical protein
MSFNFSIGKNEKRKLIGISKVYSSFEPLFLAARDTLKRSTPKDSFRKE